MQSLADLGGPGAMPRPKMPYCYVCLDFQGLLCLGPICPAPNLQSRSASTVHAFKTNSNEYKKVQR